MAEDRDSQRIGLSGLCSSILREKGEAHLPLRDIANAVLLSAPNVIIATNFLDN